MKKHLRLVFTNLFAIFCSYTFAQTNPTFTITVAGKEANAVCLGITPTFSCTSGGSDLSWTFGDGKSANGAIIPYQYTKSGTYTITLKDNTTGLSTQKNLLVNDAPKASFSVSNNSSCTGNPITFTSSATTSNTIILYKWDFGDGGGGNTSSPSTQYSYNNAGTFTPSLIVQDKNGCTGASVSNPQIKIGGSDVQIAFEANGNLFYSCENNITFSNTSNENGKTGINYVWDFGDGSSSTQKAPGVHNYPKAGVYTVALKASYGGATGCSPGFSKVVYIGKPTISINAPSSICANAIFPLTAKVNEPDFVTSPSDLSWQLNNGSVLDNGINGSFSNVPGNNQIQVTNVKGCPNTVTSQVNVLPAPKVSLSVIPNMGICTETKITAKAVTSTDPNSANITSYKWASGDGSDTVTNKIDSLDYTYPVPGSYNLGLTVKNTTGCTAIAQTTVSVKEDCTDNGYGSTYNPIFSFTSTSCEDKYTVTLKNKNLSKPIVQFIIDGISHTTVNNEATVKLTPPALGIKDKKYTVVSVFQDGTKDTKEITVIDEKANFLFVNTENDKRYCANNQFIFNTDTSVNLLNIASLNWEIADSSKGYQTIATLYGSNPSYTFLLPGTYQVKLTVTDIRETPCTDVITKTIRVKGLAMDFSADMTSFCFVNPKINLRTTINQSDSRVSSISWDMGDGAHYQTPTNTIDTTFSYQYNYSGNSNSNSYTISARAVDSAGCFVNIYKNAYINVYNPQVSFNKVDTILCNTKKIIIQNTSNVPGGTYLWKIGDTSKQYLSRSDFNVTFKSIPNPSTMDVYLKVTDAGGCTKDTLIKKYLRFTKPVATLNIANKELLNECPPYALILKNISNNATSVNWTITDRSTSSYTLFDSLFYTVRHPGPTKISLIANLDGCSDSTSESFVIKGPIATLQILDSVGCTPFNSRMKITHNNDVKGYQWDFADGNTVVSPEADSIIHTYKTAGTYIPKVSVSGIEGCTDSLDVKTKIDVSHLSPSFSAFNIQDKCANLTPKFLNTTQEISFPIKAYTWNWGSKSEDNNSKDSIAHIFNDTSLYIPVSLTALTDYCSATSDTIIVSPYFANNIKIVGDSAYCDNTNIQLKGLASQTPNNDNIYSWYSQNDSLLLSGSDSVLSLSMEKFSGDIIRLKLTNALGCSNFVSKSITSLQSPKIQLLDSIKLCKGDSSMISAESIGDFKWNSVGGMLNANSSTPTIFPNKSTFYNLTVTNMDNCQSSDSIWVNVDERIGTSFNDDYRSCLTDTVKTVINVNTLLPSVFTWNATPSDNKVINVQTPYIFVNPRQITTYHFVAHSTNVCPDESGDIVLRYAPNPTIHFASKVITQPAGTIFNLNPIIENLTPGTKFTWSPDTRLDNRFLENPSVIADKDITYRLSLYDSYGCSTTDSITVKVLCDASKLLMANAFTPNGDGRNDRFYVTGYGIRSVIHFSIIDRWGKKIFERNNTAPNDISQGWDGTVSGKAAEAGSYLYIGEVECTEGNKIPMKGIVVLIR